VQDDEATGAELGVPELAVRLRDDVRGECNCIRREPLRSRGLLQVDLGAQSYVSQGLDGAGECLWKVATAPRTRAAAHLWSVCPRRACGR